MKKNRELSAHAAESDAAIPKEEAEAAAGLNQPELPNQPAVPDHSPAVEAAHKDVIDEFGEIKLPSPITPELIEMIRREKEKGLATFQKKLLSLEGQKRQALAQGQAYGIDLIEVAKLALAQPGASFVTSEEMLDRLAYFDWRWSGIVPPARNQGACGSCWAFVATEAFESRLMYNLNRFKPVSENDGAVTQTTLCVQGVLNCVSEGDCEGGSYTNAFDHMVKQGARILQFDPTGFAFDDRKTLLGEKGPCTEKNQRNRVRALAWDFAFETEPLLVPRDAADIRKMKVALLEHGPLAVLVRKDKNFEDYREQDYPPRGVFNKHNDGKVNHAVLLTGWDEERGAWIVLNTSGREWGGSCVDEAKVEAQFPMFLPNVRNRLLREKGCMYIAYDTSQIGMLATWIEAPFSVPKNIIETLRNDKELRRKTSRAEGQADI